MTTEDANKHAGACAILLHAGNLEAALKYCADQRIDPPQCSLTANSPNANRLRAKAMEHLSDAKWWQKRLGVLAKRDAWMAEVKQQREG